MKPHSPRHTTKPATGRSRLLRLLAGLLMLLPAATACADTHRDGAGQSGTPHTGTAMENNTITLKVGDHRWTATLADNSSARALRDLLAKGDITIPMRDYAGMEKVGPLGTTLPRNDRPTNTSPGDLILYQGNQFVIYYGTNSWPLTRLGKIDNATRESLLAVLGDGNVTVTLSLQ